MIIDAMDLLYSGNYDGFCLASSDSDFTRLAVRLREGGMFVIGMGESKTPKPFRVSCDLFKTLDLLRAKTAEEPNASEAQPPAKPAPPPAPEQSARPDVKAIRGLIHTLLNENSDETGWIPLPTLKALIIKRQSDFDSRNFGKAKFSAFLADLGTLELRKTPAGHIDAARRKV